MNKKKHEISSVLRIKSLNFVEVFILSRKIDTYFQTRFYMPTVYTNLISVAFLPEGWPVNSSLFRTKKNGYSPKEY